MIEYLHHLPTVFLFVSTLLLILKRNSARKSVLLLLFACSLSSVFYKTEIAHHFEHVNDSLTQEMSLPVSVPSMYVPQDKLEDILPQPIKNTESSPLISYFKPQNKSPPF